MADVVSRLGTIGAILLLVQMMACVLVPLAATLGAVYGMHKGLGAVDRLFRSIQGIAQRISQGTRSAMTAVARPIVRAQATAAEATVFIAGTRREVAGLFENLQGRKSR